MKQLDFFGRLRAVEPWLVRWQRFKALGSAWDCRREQHHPEYGPGIKAAKLRMMALAREIRHEWRDRQALPSPTVLPRWWCEFEIETLGVRNCNTDGHGAEWYALMHLALDHAAGRNMPPWQLEFCDGWRSGESRASRKAA